jgi:hypothetical protein
MCWGYNYDGQLGNGTSTNSFVPTAVQNLTEVVSEFSGGGTTCAPGWPREPSSAGDWAAAVSWATAIPSDNTLPWTWPFLLRR